MCLILHFESMSPCKTDDSQFPPQVPEVDSKAGTNKRSSFGTVTDVPGNAINPQITEKKDVDVKSVHVKEGDTSQNPGKEAQNPGREAQNPGKEAAKGVIAPEVAEESAQKPAEEKTAEKPEAQEVKVAEKAEGASGEKDESAKASKSERQV